MRRASSLADRFWPKAARTALLHNPMEGISVTMSSRWLGEDEGFTASRDAGARKLTSLDRTLPRQPAVPTGVISLPVIVENR